MLDATEHHRLSTIYEQLRLKLLDLSKKNRMLNFTFGARSKRHLQIVDEVLEEVYRKLLADEDVSLELKSLAEPDDTPADERGEDFVSAFEHARVSDLEYLVKLEALESLGNDDEIAVAGLERELREKVRTQLGLPPRPMRKEINRAEHARSLGIDPSLELPSANQKKRSRLDLALQTLKYPDELESIASKIYDDARLAEQEMGISTLFLAFGFLEWYEADHSAKKAFAPLLLLPVRLKSKKIKGKAVYFLSAREGAIEANLSLQKLLEKNFRRELSDFENSEEDPIGSIETYYRTVHSTIEGLNRWGIRRWLVLGNFAFGRFAMYADLNPDKWSQHPAAHDLVKAILSGVERSANGSELPGIPMDYPIDDPEIEKIAPVLIHDADASQHSALIDVMLKKNVVIQGPPGTGKSQTISNIVANAIAVGKRVLFLAEKQAALDVVKRRLDQAGLGDFCLELHSDKVSPKTVTERLNTRLQHGWGKSPPTIGIATDTIWAQNRDQISGYIAALHAQCADGATPFRLIWKAVHGRTIDGDVIGAFRNITIPSKLLADTQHLVELSGELEVYAQVSGSYAKTFGHPVQSPWAAINIGDFPSYEIPKFIETLTQLRDASIDLSKYFERHQSLGADSLLGIDSLVAFDESIGTPPENCPVAEILSLDLDGLQRGFSLRRDLLAVKTELRTSPELSAGPFDRLAVAVSIVRHPAWRQFRLQTAREAYAIAMEQLEKAKAFVCILDEFLPLLDYLGLERSHPANGLEAVALAAFIASKIAPEQRTWISEFPALPTESFSALHSRWVVYTTAERSWREKLPSYGANAWPSCEDIDAAATVLRKKGIRKAFAGLTSAGKAARSLIEHLGLERASVALDELDALSQHIRELVAFENDPSAASLLGTHWRGLASPFEEISIGVRLRSVIELQLLSLPTGGKVAAKMLSLSHHQLEGIDVHADLAKRLQSAVSELGRLDERPNDQLRAELEATIQSNQEFLALDRIQELALIDLPIEHVANIAQCLARRDDLARSIAASPMAPAINALGRCEEDIEKASAAITWIKSVLQSTASDRLKHDLLSSNAKTVRSEVTAAAQVGASLKATYENLLDVVTNDFGIRELKILHPKDLVRRIDVLIEHRAELSDFLALRRQGKSLRQAGLFDFLDCAEKLVLDPMRLPSIFGTIVASQRADKMRRSSAYLGTNGQTLDARRKKFAERDREKIRADRNKVKVELLRPRPAAGSDYGPKSNWTGMALLRNEFPKQRGFVPVRSLLSRAGEAIQTLKPCFMMSPLSLAKFLTPESLAFDLVVIDEASQMRPEDALGGLLRAQQIVVVGDPKQLPPTDFFTRSDDKLSSDYDFEDIDDESILEACQKSFRELRRLKWHYRSRCESLISFSNTEFYDNSLITFPQAKPSSFSIDLVRVDGVYQARRNVAEAGRLAEEAIEFMRHFSEESEETIPTLGIVAVNTDQRDLIREELNRLAANDLLVERYRERVGAKGEEVFVKNLENVQGDERDYIFISLTYGREPAATTMKQRFGPINGKQGHRRLNVLFSRARTRIGLFASFGSADVNPSAGSNPGVHVLKRYLEYIETRGRAAVQIAGAEPDSDFEIEVADRLRDKGYGVVTQIGVSGFKIDLGIRHPDHPERFLAGVECDGASYHSSKSARDRDRLREEVLRGLGWALVRVWSTDWFDDPVLETERLVRKLEELRLQSQPRFKDSWSVSSLFETRFPFGTEQGSAYDQADVSFSASEPEVAPTAQAEFFASDATIPSFTSIEGPLTEADAFKALEIFREKVIRPAYHDWEPQRSILRDSMIETFIRQKITEPDDWFNKVPLYQRSGTSAKEKLQFLDQICEIVEKISNT